MFLKIGLALACFLFAIHEDLKGIADGAALQEGDFVDSLASGDTATGPYLLVAFGLLTIYRALTDR